jgi:hypothetical protein
VKQTTYTKLSVSLIKYQAAKSICPWRYISISSALGTSKRSSEYFTRREVLPVPTGCDPESIWTVVARRKIYDPAGNQPRSVNIPWLGSASHYQDKVHTAKYTVFIVQAYQTSQYVVPRGDIILGKWRSSFAGSSDGKINVQSAWALQHPT